MSEIKALLVESALSLGFERAVVASLEPMELEAEFYKHWLELGYAASMDYLKRDYKKRNDPGRLFEGAKSAILLYASYYTEPPADPGAGWGRVAGYAVGLDYHFVIKEKLALLKALLEEKLGRKFSGKFFTDDVELYEQGLAARHGLGFIGKNSLVIGPKLMGSYHFLAEIFTDLELEADQKYEGTCGACFRCGKICPTEAILEGKMLDSNLCISFLTIENKGAVPLELRERLGSWVFGCDLCQEVCPYNQKPPITKWTEFQPESGAGHYLDLFSIIKMQSKAEFNARFAKSPISRARRKGLKRNALVVIGNRRPDGGQKQLIEFMQEEEDPVLFEHALWALSRYEPGKDIIANLYAKSEQDKKQLFSAYL